MNFDVVKVDLGVVVIEAHSDISVEALTMVMIDVEFDMVVMDISDFDYDNMVDIVSLD